MTELSPRPSADKNHSPPPSYGGGAPSYGAEGEGHVPARAEFVIGFEADFTKQVMEGPLGEFTGFYTPAPQPIAKVTAITHRNGAVFQALPTGVPPTENHILKQLS
jgi:UbiD family decarboxylase